MRAIDADELKKCVLKWLPQDQCGQEEKEMPLETDICVSMLMEIDEQPTIQPEPHWIPVTEDIPDEERECWITPKTTSKVYRGVFTRHYGECHRTGFICDDGFMWLNTALAWMYCEVPEPYKGVTT